MTITGLVLSGGGARGAYEAGVLAGLAEATGAGTEGPPLFQVVAGTSVGALNGAWTVAHGHRADHSFASLAEPSRYLEGALPARASPRRSERPAGLVLPLPSGAPAQGAAGSLLITLVMVLGATEPRHLLMVGVALRL